MRPPSVIARALFALGMSLGLAGCLTVQEHRARQMHSQLAHLDEATQQRLLRGELQLGDSPLAAYVALGTPQYTREAVAADAEPAPWVWVYWGMVPEAERSESDTAPPPRIFTRAEMRLPKAGEKRTELRLYFQDEALVSWQLGAIDTEAAGTAKGLTLGIFPERSNL